MECLRFLFRYWVELGTVRRNCLLRSSNDSWFCESCTKLINLAKKFILSLKKCKKGLKKSTELLRSWNHIILTTFLGPSPTRSPMLSGLVTCLLDFSSWQANGRWEGQKVRYLSPLYLAGWESISFANQNNSTGIWHRSKNSVTICVQMAGGNLPQMSKKVHQQKIKKNSS